MTDIEKRVWRLEQDRAIRDLKMRYLRSADGKDPAGMRECFTEDAQIEFEGFPVFDNRDAFIAVYAEMGCAPGIFDIHQGGTGIIEFTGEETATGWWPLYFHNINLAQNTLTQLGVEYQDSYIFQGGKWLIAKTISRRKSCLIHSVDVNGEMQVVAMGEAPEHFGDNPQDADHD